VASGILQAGSGRLHCRKTRAGAASPLKCLSSLAFGPRYPSGTGFAICWVFGTKAQPEDRPLPKGTTVNLTVWLPALLLLGLATMGLMFAFVSGCEKV
jgi:hypothetical protein